MKVQHLLGIAALVGLSSAISVRANSIGINFVGSDTANGTTLSTDTAGVVPQANFNNVTSANATVPALVDNTGAVTAVGLTVSGGGFYSSAGGGNVHATAGGDEKLNEGFIYGDGTTMITGLPYASYNVYVYELNDAAGRVETTTLGTSTFYGSAANPGDTSHIDGDPATSYTYTQSTSTDSANPTVGGDYVLFTGVTGSSFTVTDTAPGNGYLNGIQIVDTSPTPEPATVAMLAIAGCGLLSRRRKG